jgi:hypothetical protein
MLWSGKGIVFLRILGDSPATVATITIIRFHFQDRWEKEKKCRKLSSFSVWCGLLFLLHWQKGRASLGALFVQSSQLFPDSSAFELTPENTNGVTGTTLSVIPQIQSFFPNLPNTTYLSESSDNAPCFLLKALLYPVSCVLQWENRMGCTYPLKVFFFFLSIFKSCSQYVTQAGLKLLIPLPHPPT